MRISVLLSLLVFVLFIACTTNPNQEENSVIAPLIAERPTSAKAKNGQYISWKEHLIDDVSITGVEISGSDGLVLADLDKDGIEDIISVHESDTEYDGIAKGHIRIAFGSTDPDKWELITLAEGADAGAAEDVAVADVNGDGYPDIIAACELAHLIYFQNPGQNIRTQKWKRLIPSVTKDRGSYIRVFFADFDQDGIPEVVAPNKGKQSPSLKEQANAISWYAITGDPLEDASWVEHELIKVIVPINSEPVDLDQDGDLDIIGGSRGEGRIFWFENITEDAIAFKEHRIEVEGTAIPMEQRDERYKKLEQTVTTGFNMDYYDFNADGRLDILLTEYIFTHLVWLEQPEDPTQTWKLHSVGNLLPDQMVGFIIQDINGDGLVDIMTGSYSRGERAGDGDEDLNTPMGRLAWFEQTKAGGINWIRHDISRRRRGMFDKFIPRDLDKDGDMDFLSTRGNSLPYDGVFWLEQVRTTEPVSNFKAARAKESAEVPLPY